MAASSRTFESFAGRYSIGWIDHLAAQGDTPHSCALHDPLADAAVAHPNLVRFAPARLTVHTGDELRGGMITELDPRSPNARVAIAVDVAGFGSLFRDLMGRP